MPPSKILRKRTTGLPGPAKATAMRQHSQVLSRAIVAVSSLPPGLSSQAKASAAPAYGFPSAFAAATFLLSIQAAKARPSLSSATASKRWLGEPLVIGCGASKVLPPSDDRTINAWPLYLSSRVANVTTTRPPSPMTIFGRASGPSSSGSDVAGSVTGVDSVLPRSVEFASETRPPAAQISHSLPSGANAAVTTLAQLSAVV